jgi:hypothetical protein
MKCPIDHLMSLQYKPYGKQVNETAAVYQISFAIQQCPVRKFNIFVLENVRFVAYSQRLFCRS